MKNGKWRILVLTVMIFLFGSGCFSNEATEYMDLVRSTLDAGYHGNMDNYLRLSDSSKEQADGLYLSMQNYVETWVKYYTFVVEEYLTEEQHEAFRKLSRDLLNAARYSVEEAVKQSDNQYTVKVNITPIRFWEQISAELEQEMESYNTKHSAVDTSNEEQIAVLEREYADHILTICENYIAKVEYEPQISMDLTVNVKDRKGNVDASEWDALDDVILNVQYILDAYGVAEE